jgi:STE24 endopeptidase
MFADLAVGGLYTLAWLVLGWSESLKTFLQGFTSSEWFLVAVFGLVFGAGFVLVGLPLSYLSGYYLPKRFGQSNQGLAGWVSDQLKSLLLLGVVGLFLLEVIYAVLRLFPETWWLWAALFMLVFSVLLSNLAPVLILPLFYKLTPLGEEHAGLVQRLMRLSEQAKAHVKGVYRFDMSRRTKSANAALTGLGNTRRILLGDTLLDEFTDDEIETILAHELAHHVHHDIPLGIAVESLLTLAGLYLSSLVLEWGVGYFGFAGVADIAALPLFALVMGGYGLLTLPLSNGYSRWRERKADEYALRTTRNGAAFASAMVRLANQNLAEVSPGPWEEFLLHSHPALSKRVAMAKSYE